MAEETLSFFPPERMSISHHQIIKITAQTIATKTTKAIAIRIISVEVYETEGSKSGVAADATGINEKFIKLN